MSARGAADFLTRATTILATIFVLMSIGLAAYAGVQRAQRPIDTSLARPLGTAPATGAPAPATGGVPLADPLAGAASAPLVPPLTPAPVRPAAEPAPTRPDRTPETKPAADKPAASKPAATKPAAEKPNAAASAPASPPSRTTDPKAPALGTGTSAPKPAPAASPLPTPKADSTPAPAASGATSAPQ